MTDVPNPIDVVSELWHPAASPQFVAAQSEAMSFVTGTCTEAHLRVIDAGIGFQNDHRVFGDAAAEVQAFRAVPLDEPSPRVVSRIAGIAFATRILANARQIGATEPADFLLNPHSLIDGRLPARVFDRGQLTSHRLLQFRTALRVAVEGAGIQPRVVRAPR